MNEKSCRGGGSVICNLMCHETITSSRIRQQAQGLAERQRRDVELRCGSSKAPLIGNSDECGQIGQVSHDPLLSFSQCRMQWISGFSFPICIDILAERGAAE